MQELVLFSTPLYKQTSARADIPFGTVSTAPFSDLDIALIHRWNMDNDDDGLRFDI